MAKPKLRFRKTQCVKVQWNDAVKFWPLDNEFFVWEQIRALIDAGHKVTVESFVFETPVYEEC